MAEFGNKRYGNLDKGFWDNWTMEENELGGYNLTMHSFLISRTYENHSMGKMDDEKKDNMSLRWEVLCLLIYTTHLG